MTPIKFEYYSKMERTLSPNFHQNMLEKALVKKVKWRIFWKLHDCILTVHMEGKYTEWPNPQKAENHACDRQSGLNDSAPRHHIATGCLRQSGLINRATPCSSLITGRVTAVLVRLSGASISRRFFLNDCGITAVQGRTTIHFSKLYMYTTRWN